MTNQKSRSHPVRFYLDAISRDRHEADKVFLHVHSALQAAADLEAVNSELLKAAKAFHDEAHTNGVDCCYLLAAIKKAEAKL